MAITTVQIPDELLKKAKNAGINLSEEFRDSVRRRLNVMSGKVEDIDYEIESERLRKAEAKVKMWSDIAEEAKKKMELYDEKKQQETNLHLEKQKEEALKQKTCMECGSIHGEGYKWHVFKIGNICNACYQVKAGTKFKEWNE